MEKDTHITEVVFRADKNGAFKGQVFAMFPHEVCDFSGNVTSYQHVGQHSGANYSGCVAKTRLCTEEEYKDLKKELESLGYNLKVIKKQNYSKWRESYKEVRGVK